MTNNTNTRTTMTTDELSDLLVSLNDAIASVLSEYAMLEDMSADESDECLNSATHAVVSVFGY